MIREQNKTYEIRLRRHGDAVRGEIVRQEDGTSTSIGSLSDLVEVMHGEMDAMRSADDSNLTALLTAAGKDRQEIGA